MLIVQNANQPAAIRNAIVDLGLSETIDVRVAAAYVTLGGSDILLKALRDAVGVAAFDAIPKLLVTSFDFGLTEPQALRRWLNFGNSEVFVAGSERLAQGSLRPRRAFHPKLYAFGRADQTFATLVGSANLTSRGFNVNTEAAWAEQAVPSALIDAAFVKARVGTILLNAELLKAYEELRNAQPATPELNLEVQPVEAAAPVAAEDIALFRTSIQTGLVDPAAYEAMWVQGEALQGGSGNQLELPRGGHRFFGFHFNQYDYPHNLTIGHPVLRSGTREWLDRPLTWHGNNKMERMNLPTFAQGGFSYADSAVMFRRLPDGSFELIVTPWDSDLSRAWRQASAKSQTLFRLGSVATNRVVGLI